MRFFFLGPILSVATIASHVSASPPPPPPAYMMDAARDLVPPGRPDKARWAAWFAEDVKAYENNVLVADGKAAWEQWRAVNYDRGFVNNLLWSADGIGNLLVVDDIDDRSGLPAPWPPGDPRPESRMTAYKLGGDQHIHVIQISRAKAFWRRSTP